MNTKKNVITTWLEQVEGRLIAIGIEEESILEMIEENNRITSCDLLHSTLLCEGKVDENVGKFLPIRRLRRYFKKKKHDAMLVNYTHVSPYMKTFIRDSIDITKKTICFYHLDEDTLAFLKKRYHRYHASLKEREEQNEFILEVDVTKAKTHVIQNWFYFLIDTVRNGIELLSDFLVN